MNGDATLSPELKTQTIIIAGKDESDASDEESHVLSRPTMNKQRYNSSKGGPLVASISLQNRYGRDTGSSVTNGPVP